MKANIRPALKKQIVAAARTWQVALNAWTEAQTEKEQSKNAEDLRKANRSLYVWAQASAESEGALKAFCQVFGSNAVSAAILASDITIIPTCIITTKQAR